MRIGIAPLAGATAYSANDETKEWWLRRSPPFESRVEPSSSVPSGRARADTSQRLVLPRAQTSQCPQ